MPAIKVAVLVGSLRKGSYTRKVAKAIMALAPSSMEMVIVEIGDLNLYNPDMEDDDPPRHWTEFRDCIRRYDAILFATPEYNRSVPAALKNALDVGSRPYGKSVWFGKPAAVVSVSPGLIGAFGANHHLRQSLVFVNVPVMQQPEAYIGNAAKLFDADDELIVDSTKEFLLNFIDAFIVWIKTIKPDAGK